MKRIFMLCLFGVIILTLAAEYTDDELRSMPANNFKPMICVLSASDSGMEIRIGDDDTTVFSTTGLFQYSVAGLTPVDYEGYSYVYTKMPGESEWTIMWDDTFDIEYEVDVEPGEILYIIISPDDYVRDVSRLYIPSHRPQIAFANLTDMDQYNLEASLEFGSHNEVWFDELSDYNVTDFKTAEGIYCSLFWQTRDLSGTQEYNFYPDADGDAAIEILDDNKWYMVMTYDLSTTEHRCRFIDVTPSAAWIKN